MKIVESPHEAYAQIDFWRNQGLRIGLVLTMGALHEGHYSLVRRSVRECDISVASIFVNPTQFGPQEDLARYPRTLERDLAGLRDSGTDLVFLPTQNALYPEGFSTFVQPPDSATVLEGEFRPGHFRGVVTIVLKFFHLLPASVAYFGQKDYQQLTVIRRMVEDLNVPIRVEACPTIREPDGLAMSSRNGYLSASQRQSALCLWKALSRAKSLMEKGIRDVCTLEQAMQDVLLTEGAESIDYARVVDRESLEALASTVDRPAVALIAAHVGNTRLIDNLLLDHADEATPGRSSELDLV